MSSALKKTMSDTKLDAALCERIQRAMVSWYRRGHRDLPWRRTNDPYRIWISEIMCQQTQVDTVVPRYERFVERFPNVRALATASEEAVCEEWAGLGYYSRARNLHRAAGWVVRENEGEMPASADALRKLPGIGRYTAGAIASIAYGEPAPIVDGNVARVLSRVFLVDHAPNSSSGQRALWSLAEQLVPPSDPGAFNQSVMELGALVCTPKRVSCLLCPLQSDCEARRQGVVDRFPVPKVRPPRRLLPVAMAWLETEDGSVWLEQRPLEGLWAGLWELPSADSPAELATKLGGVSLSEPLAQVEHTLSHRDVVATIHTGSAPEAPPERFRLYPDPLSAPLSGLARKAIVAARAAVGQAEGRVEISE